jgi:photosystem II stability/assembly factor-like uncharacterized protein
MKKSLTFLCLLFLVFSSINAQKADEPEPQYSPQTYSGLAFRNIGPALMSGRISDIAVHPEDNSFWYIAVGSGGVWKTENSGTTWQPVFDTQESYSIGCVTIDPNHPEIVWVGTGENVSGRHVGFGDGIYKSLNQGRTWTNMGLTESEHISKIVIDPTDYKVVYVAAEGPLWSSGGERGLYKTVDGGETWSLSLEISPDTGVTDVVRDPENPDILYAAAYQRRRSVAAFMAGGPESGIYKTTDGGESWKELKVGLPQGDMGRIGLAVSPFDPRVVYATIEASEKERGFYRSDDRGESWEKRSNYISGGTGPHYYQEIYADPHEFDRVYQMDVWTHVTDDGGKTWGRLNEVHKHSDNHALAFVPDDPDFLLAGNDGGLYQSWDRGQTWTYAANLPVTQFYKIALDNSEPYYHVHGGTQDNSSQMGPSRTLNINGIRNNDWVITTGADGYACAIDPENPDIIYAETQNGNLNRFDRKSGELVRIQPSEQAGDEPYRWNWDSPVIISPHSHTRLYFAAQFVFRSDDRGNSWTRISPDLTRSTFRYEEEIMGRTWSIDALWDHGAMSMYSTITALSESPVEEGLIYACTDDGLIQVTENGGENWRKIDNIPGIPGRCFVNDIRASQHDPDTVMAALDNHKTGDFKPYLILSRDRGRTWKPVTKDLPGRMIVWAITEDHKQPGMWFIGTEFGIYFTRDNGSHWTELKGGLPTIAFRDIEIQEKEDDLVGASFGRGIYILDDYAPLRHMDAGTLGREAALFPVKKASMYVPRRPLSLRGKAFLGDNFYIAPNPPFGAVISYYLKDPLQTIKEKRRAEESKLRTAGKTIMFPGWDRLRKEEQEDKPAVILTIRDASGQVVRHLTGPAGTGFHRIAWNLRYPDLSPTRLEDREMEPWSDPPAGPLAAPGEYSVSLSKRVNGEFIPLADPQTFQVESLGLASLKTEDRKALLAFQKKVGELQRAAMGAASAVQESIRQIQYMKKALINTPDADPGLYKAALSLEKDLQDAMTQLYGDRTVRRYSEATAPSLIHRLDAQIQATAPITETHNQNYQIAAGEFDKLEETLRRLVETELKNLGEALEAAGAPWTPGRGIPEWKKK